MPSTVCFGECLAHSWFFTSQQIRASKSSHCIYAQPAIISQIYRWLGSVAPLLAVARCRALLCSFRMRVATLRLFLQCRMGNSVQEAQVLTRLQHLPRQFQDLTSHTSTGVLSLTWHCTGPPCLASFWYLGSAHRIFFSHLVPSWSAAVDISWDCASSSWMPGPAPFMHT